MAGEKTRYQQQPEMYLTICEQKFDEQIRRPYLNEELLFASRTPAG